MKQPDKEEKEVHFMQHDDQNQYGIETTLSDNKLREQINTFQHEQLLKLIANGFYQELMNYGIDQKDVIVVSTHILDRLLDGNSKLETDSGYYNKFFTLKNIKIDGDNQSRLTIDDISISPLESSLYEQVALWLKNPEIKYSFISLFPETESTLQEYFEQSTRDYFAIFYKNEPVGIIGNDNIDNISHKSEMRKFIGNTRIQGQGIGKRATFLFLYHCFVNMKLNKVFIHSGNTNIRNINLNCKFGFHLEGVFFEDAFLGNKKRDIVRMGLLRSKWIEIFSDSLKK